MLVAGLAAAAGIHLAVSFQHSLTGTHGAFFLAAGVSQAAVAAAVAHRTTAPRLAGAAVLNVALILTWVVMRSPAVLAGSAPDALSATATLFEVMAVVATASLGALALPGPSSARRPAAALGLAALVAVGIAGFADGGHDDHHHAPSAPVVAVSDRSPAQSDELLGDPPRDAEEAQDVDAEVEVDVGHDHADAAPHDH